MAAGAQLGGVAARVRGMHPRQTARELMRSFDEYDVLTYASAIAFQGIFALIPLALVALGLLGLFQLEGVWNDHLAPELRGQVSHAVFEVFDSTVRRVLGSRQLFWVTAGALLLLAVASVVRWAPAEQRQWQWVTFGTGLVVVAWLGMSAVFGWYLRDVASYGSIFGNLATIIVAFEYAYLSAIVFLAGLALDGLAQARG